MPTSAYGCSPRGPRATRAAQPPSSTWATYRCPHSPLLPPRPHPMDGPCSGAAAQPRCLAVRGAFGAPALAAVWGHRHPARAQAAKMAYSKAWDLEPSNSKTKADLEHVLSEIAGMRVVLPERT